VSKSRSHFHVSPASDLLRLLAQAPPWFRFMGSSLACSVDERKPRPVNDRHIVNVVLVVGFRLVCLLVCLFGLSFGFGFRLIIASWSLEIALEYEHLMDIVVIMVGSHFVSHIPHLASVSFTRFTFQFLQSPASAFVFESHISILPHRRIQRREECKGTRLTMQCGVHRWNSR
jgi:hypothetical protein